MAVFVPDVVTVGCGSGGVVWPPLEHRNRSAQFETDGPLAAHYGAVRRHDGKGTAGGRDGLQLGACDHVPGRPARRNRCAAVELHLRLQYRARRLSQSPVRPWSQTETAGTRSDHRLGVAMPFAQALQTALLSA